MNFNPRIVQAATAELLPSSSPCTAQQNIMEEWSRHQTKRNNPDIAQKNITCEVQTTHYKILPKDSPGTAQQIIACG